MDAYIARYTVMSHRVASINGVTIGPGQRAFFLMAGTGFGQQAMWHCSLLSMAVCQSTKGNFSTSSNRCVAMATWLSPIFTAIHDTDNICRLDLTFNTSPKIHGIQRSAIFRQDPLRASAPAGVAPTALHPPNQCHHRQLPPSTTTSLTTATRATRSQTARSTTTLILTLPTLT